MQLLEISLFFTVLASRFRRKLYIFYFVLWFPSTNHILRIRCVLGGGALLGLLVGYTVEILLRCEGILVDRKGICQWEGTINRGSERDNICCFGFEFTGQRGIQARLITWGKLFWFLWICYLILAPFSFIWVYEFTIAVEVQVLTNSLMLTFSICTYAWRSNFSLTDSSMATNRCAATKIHVRERQ